jgi:hypothetical protein
MRRLTNTAHGHIIWWVDGWYLFTSPEHHHTHNRHIKHTKSKKLSDTDQFDHKHITNPSITHTDKVMHALANCVKVIQGMMGKARNSQVTQYLQWIVDATQPHLQARPDCFKETMTPSGTPNHQRVPRVQTPPSVPTPHIEGNQRITQTMLLPTPVTRVPVNGASTNTPTAMPAHLNKQ